MSKFQIDPKVQIFISVLVGALSFFASSSLPTSVPPDTAKAIHDWSALFAQFWLTVVTPVMLAYTSSNPGPLAPPDSPGVIAAKAKADALVVQDAKDVKPSV